MTGYAEMEISQGEDWGLQIIWTDLINDAYQVCHPMRLQARAASGQVVIDISSVDQESEQSPGTTPRMVYSTEGGVIQVIIPSSITSQLPVGELYYDLFTSYKSTSYDFVTNEETPTVRLAKLIQGKVHVMGRVTKNV